jgi:hypothetical protein
MAYAGGAVGQTNGATSILTTFYNTGPLIASSDNPTLLCEGSYAGGIMGLIHYGALTIKDCQNFGEVIAIASSVIAGGMIGSSFDAKVTVSKCYNAGQVIITSFSLTYGGGIIGGAVGSHTMITDSFNIGTIEIQVPHKAHAGGIAGCILTHLTKITNCYNTGSVIVSGATNIIVGGIVGEVILHSAITNCYFIEGRIIKNGTPVDTLVGYGSATVDGDSDGIPRPGPQGSGAKAEEDMRWSLEDALSGDSIYYIKRTGNVKGWDFEKTWTIIAGINGGYPMLTPGPGDDDEEEEEQGIYEEPEEEAEEEAEEEKLAPARTPGKPGQKDIFMWIFWLAVFTVLVIAGGRYCIAAGKRRGEEEE